MKPGSHVTTSARYRRKLAAEENAAYLALQARVVARALMPIWIVVTLVQILLYALGLYLLIYLS